MLHEALKGGDVVRRFDERVPFGIVYRIIHIRSFRRARHSDDEIIVLDYDGNLRATSRWLIKRWPAELPLPLRT